MTRDVDEETGVEKQRVSALGRVLFLFVSAALILGGCSRPAGEADPVPQATSRAELRTQPIRLGDIDPDTPARRTQRLQPLADYLADRMADLGFTNGEVVIARDMDEMSRFVLNGEVDVFIDSGLPTIVVQERSGSKIVLRRWAQGSGEYRTLFVSAAESGIQSLEELRGSFLALQEEYSTSGFLLPAGTLVSRGFQINRVGGPDEPASPAGVDYFFSHDEENTIELVRTGRAPAGAISNQDYEQLPEELQGDLQVIGETASVPRQLVSVRADLDDAVSDRLVQELLALAGPGDDPVFLEEFDNAWSWKFEPVTPETDAQIDHLRELAGLLGLL